MNIVSLLNVSNQCNLLADSGFMFQRLLLQELVHQGHSAWLIAPHEAQRLTTIEVLPATPPRTKYHARFEFDWNMFVVSTEDIWKNADVLLVNQPELAPNFAALAAVYRKKPIPLVSYVHYLPFDGLNGTGAAFDLSLNDNGMGKWIIGALRSAIENCDATIIGSHFGASLLKSEIGNPKRLEVIAPPVEPNLAFLAAKSPPPGCLKMLYNHRLYAHYGTESLFQWLDKAHTESDVGFEVWVTDPAGMRSPERNKLDNKSERLRQKIGEHPYVRLISAETREQYYKLLGSTHVCLAPQRRSPLWSMALCDALAAGRTVLAPRSGAYPEILDHKHLCFYEDKDDFVRQVIDWTEHIPKPDPMVADCIQQRLSPKQVANRFMKIFSEVVSDGK